MLELFKTNIIQADEIRAKEGLRTSPSYRQTVQELAAEQAFALLQGRDPAIAAAYPSPAPKPVATALAIAEPTEGDRFAAEYAELAKTLGVATWPVARDLRLHNLLAEEGITVYNLQAVEAYMLSITPADKTWVWMAVRGCDALGSWSEVLYRGQSNAQVRAALLGKEINVLYSKRMPFPVLQTMSRLLTRMPEGLVFLATEVIDVPKPDPFLAVRLVNSSELFVIERWDEPGFRGL